MRSVLVFALLLLSPLAASAGWQSLQQEARGQTVWFNAWGGDPAVNRYLDWVSGEVKRDYAIDLRIVHIADAADAVKRIQTEARAGRSKGGSIDLLWVNGENFRTLKNARLLQTRWAETLPNWRFVDTRGFLYPHRRRRVAVGRRAAHFYRPPLTNARRAHHSAGAAGFRRRASRQRHLPASAGFYRYRVS